MKFLNKNIFLLIFIYFKLQSSSANNFNLKKNSILEFFTDYIKNLFDPQPLLQIPLMNNLKSLEIINKWKFSICLGKCEKFQFISTRYSSYKRLVVFNIRNSIDKLHFIKSLPQISSVHLDISLVVVIIDDLNFKKSKFLNEFKTVNLERILGRFLIVSFPVEFNTYEIKNDKIYWLLFCYFCKFNEFSQMSKNPLPKEHQIFNIFIEIVNKTFEENYTTIYKENEGNMEIKAWQKAYWFGLSWIAIKEILIRKFKINFDMEEIFGKPIFKYKYQSGINNPNNYWSGYYLIHNFDQGLTFNYCNKNVEYQDIPFTIIFEPLKPTVWVLLLTYSIVLGFITKRTKTFIDVWLCFLGQPNTHWKNPTKKIIFLCFILSLITQLFYLTHFTSFIISPRKTLAIQTNKELFNKGYQVLSGFVWRLEWNNNFMRNDLKNDSLIVFNDTLCKDYDTHRWEIKCMGKNPGIVTFAELTKFAPSFIAASKWYNPGVQCFFCQTPWRTYHDYILFEGHYAKQIYYFAQWIFSAGIIDRWESAYMAGTKRATEAFEDLSNLNQVNLEGKQVVIFQIYLVLMGISSIVFCIESIKPFVEKFKFLL